MQWTRPLCLVLTHSVILRTFLDRKGEQIFSLKLWKGSWRMEFWGTGRMVCKVSDVSISELYTWRRTQSSGLILYRHCTWFFFFKEDDLYTEIPQDVSVGQIHIIQANSISFFRIHFKAWHGKYLVTQQELQDHTCLLSKKLSVITAFTHIHFHSHIILQSKWAVSGA